MFYGGEAALRLRPGCESVACLRSAPRPSFLKTEENTGHRACIDKLSGKTGRVRGAAPQAYSKEHEETISKAVE